MATAIKTPKCMYYTSGCGWILESYASASGDARRRASQLRKLGYKVAVSPLGSQVTPLGLIRLTMVNISSRDNHKDITDIPSAAKFEWTR